MSIVSIEELTQPKREEIEKHIDDILTRNNPRMSKAERDFVIKYEMKYWRNYENTTNAKKNKRD